MAAFKDLTGKTFTSLTVIKATSDRDSSGSVIWKCKCKCNNITYNSGRLLNSGNTKSCGCLHKETAKNQGHKNKIHGSSYSKDKGGLQLDYAIWCGMKRRCYNKKDKFYCNYGGRGIKVCKEWLNNFEDFAKYIRTLPNCPSNKILKSRGKGKQLKVSIDRIKNNENYKRGNLKWSTKKEQVSNRSNTVTVTYLGQTITLAEAVDKYAVVNYKTVHLRINRYGWELEKALLTPSRMNAA